MRFGFLLLLLARTGTLCGQQIEDPPVVVPKKLLSREELQETEKADLLKQARSLYGLGVLRERGDRILEALRLFEEALKLDADSVVIRRSLIPIYFTLGREPEARAFAKTVLAADPNDYEIAVRYSTLLKRNREGVAAVEALRLALKSKTLSDRVDRQLMIRLDLCALLHELNDFAGEMLALQQMLDLIETRRGDLILTTTFREEELLQFRIEGYEKLAHASMKVKNFDLARKGFEIARRLMVDTGENGATEASNRIDWHLCEIATAQGRFQDALRYLETYLRQGRVSVEPYERKLLLLRKLKRDREVIETARKFATDQPHHLGLQLLLAKELSEEGRTQPEAERVYRSLAAQYTKPDIYRGWFKLYQTTDRMEQVLNLINDTLVMLRDKNKSAEERESAQDRYRAMLRVLSEEPELVRNLLTAAGNELKNIQFGNRKELDTWELLARLAASTRQLDRAEAFYRQCLQIAPPFQREDVQQGLIEVLRLSHQWKEMAETCQRLLQRPMREKNPTEAFYRSSLGQALGELGRSEEACLQFDRAVELAPSDGWKLSIREQKVRALSHAGKDNEAIEECEKMLKEYRLPNEQRQVRITYGTALDLAGKHEEADRQFEILLEIDPNDALANNNLGYHWAERNVKLDEAERRIRRALELDRQQKDRDSDNAAYLDSLGWVLFRKGQLDEARKMLEQASSMPEGSLDGTVWDHLGDVYFKQKETAKAKQAWTTALKLFANDARAKREGRIEDGKRKLQILSSGIGKEEKR
jgi:tetratricopeptide (TPR) repeat protein